jgi:hypothetical protein
MFRTATMVIAALASLSGCAWFRGSGAAAGSPYLSTKLCGVQIDGKTRATRLRLLLTALRPLPTNGTLEVDFPNPADDAKTLTVRQRLTGKEQTIEVLSPSLTAMRPRSYHVVARVYLPGDTTRALGTHTVRCESLVDDRELP